MIYKKRGELCLVLAIALLLLLTSCALNKTSITGLAVLDENATNETTSANANTNETIATETTTAIKEAKEKKEKETPAEKQEEKPEKKEPNKPPVWKSDVNEFILKGKTIIDLSNYFYDENKDHLAYLFTKPDNVDVDVDGNIVTLTPKWHNFTTSIAFTATDGEKATTKNITLIVPEKTISINLEYNPGTNYDSDDNGVETTTGVIDLNVQGTQFSWDADQTKLCTRWTTYSLDD